MPCVWQFANLCNIINTTKQDFFFLQIITPKGYKHLVSVPRTTRENMTLEEEDYVLIQATEEGSRYPAEIIQIIDYEYERFFRTHNLWPATYDIEGYVERLADKIERAEEDAVRKSLQRTKSKEANNREFDAYSFDRKTLDEVLNSSCSPKCCGRYSKLENHIPEKDHNLDLGQCTPTKSVANSITKVPSTPEIITTLVSRSDKECMTESPTIPDVVVTDNDNELLEKNSVPCSANTHHTRGTNTDKLMLIKKSKFCKRLKHAFSGTSGCCKKSCGATSRTYIMDKKSIGAGPCYSSLTTGHDRMPPAYGHYTPWRMSKKQAKRLRDAQYAHLFSRLNKNPWQVGNQR